MFILFIVVVLKSFFDRELMKGRRVLGCFFDLFDLWKGIIFLMNFKVLVIWG